MKDLRGFTLIELLIVVGLIGVLGAVMITLLNPLEQISKANDAKRKDNLSQVQQALEFYYQDQGSYPASTATYQISLPSGAKAWGSAWQPYINILPRDPKATQTYVYFSPPASGGQTYYLYASLERGSKDPQGCNSGNACLSLSQGGFPSANACGGTCNYGLSSSNVTP